MKNRTLAEISETILHQNNIVLLPHIGADGDSLGCISALSLALLKLNKNVQIVVPETISLGYSFLEKSTDLTMDHFLPIGELYIILDTTAKERIPFYGQLEEEKRKGKKVIIIDHHIAAAPEKVADFFYIDSNRASCSELVLDLIKELKIEIDKDISTALLTGIIADTGAFQNQNTKAETFEAAAFLMKKGARIVSIVESAFLKAPIETLRLRGLILERLIYNEGKKIACSFIKNEDYAKFNVTPDSVSGIANILNEIEDLNILFFISEEKNGVLKVSTRTRKLNIDLSKFAQGFGGGGHRGAAGFKVKEPLDCFIEKIKTGKILDNHLL